MMKTKLLLPALLLLSNSMLFESCLWASQHNNLDSKNQSSTAGSTLHTQSAESSNSPAEVSISTTSHKPTQNKKAIKHLAVVPITKDSLAKLLDSIAWNETTHSFEGGVPTGPPATFKFIFTNYSNHPIKVKGVDAACSCTATDFTRTEIPPGSSGWIQAAYKTENTFGYFKKYVDVFFEGSPNKHRLYLTGSVDPYKH